MIIGDYEYKHIKVNTRQLSINFEAPKTYRNIIKCWYVTGNDKDFQQEHQGWNPFIEVIEDVLCGLVIKWHKSYKFNIRIIKTDDNIYTLKFTRKRKK